MEYKQRIKARPHLAPPCRVAGEQSYGAVFQLGHSDGQCSLSSHLIAYTLASLGRCSFLEPLWAMLLGNVECVLTSFREPQGIIACCNPVPPLVRQQINEMHLLIQQAREMPLLKVRSSPTPQVLSSVCCRLAPFTRESVSILKKMPEEIIGFRKSSGCVFMIVRS